MVYSFILGNLKNLRIVVLLFTLFMIFYIYSSNWPILIKFISSLLVLFIGINIASATNLLLNIPKSIMYLRTVDGKEYKKVLFLEDHDEYIFILDKEDKVIRLYKNNIVELK